MDVSDFIYTLGKFAVHIRAYGMGNLSAVDVVHNDGGEWQVLVEGNPVTLAVQVAEDVTLLAAVEKVNRLHTDDAYYEELKAERQAALAEAKPKARRRSKKKVADAD